MEKEEVVEEEEEDEGSVGPEEGKGLHKALGPE